MSPIKKTPTTAGKKPASKVGKSAVKPAVTAKTSRAKSSESSSHGYQKINSAGKNLIIVESPTKARTISKYLSNEYVVRATGGHIVDLPTNDIGVDIEADFEPKYEVLERKKHLVADLARSAETAKAVYIATDPDREGEAIAWHVMNVMKKAKVPIYRVEFHEITPNAVKKSLTEQGVVDQKRVDAQQARRVLDRLVGYMVSPLLWKVITKGLSAGRVQSVALRLICEREGLITEFVKEEYWTIEGLFRGENTDPFLAKLHKVDKKRMDTKTIALHSEEEATAIVNRVKEASYSITEIKKSRKLQHPSPPYITSTLQQEASRKINFTTKRTMSTAQTLYEGVELGDKGTVGLITYMRTDSTRVSSQANDLAREYIEKSFGEQYLVPKVRVYSNKKGAVQDAHEAIRPTDVNLTPDLVKPYLSADQYKLYELIWKRFVATQMASAELDVTSVNIGGREGKSTTNSTPTIEFKTSGQILRFDGFLKLYGFQIATDEKSEKDEDEIEEERSNQPLPVNLTEGMPLILIKPDPKQHFTQPPPRFTEASLVKELDELGIGRPSTYATIISTLLDRQYVEKAEKSFSPTDLGFRVNTVLVAQFPDLFNVTFTAHMEDDLDKIEEGQEWRSVIKEFYTPFKTALDSAFGNKEVLKKSQLELVGRDCPLCGNPLAFRFSKKGRFISCTAFPKCKHAENIEELVPVKSERKCPLCSAEMVVRSGRFGQFLGCSKYPECRGIAPLVEGKQCPVLDCKGSVLQRKSGKGKIYYKCTQAGCKFISWDPVVDEPCP